MAGLLDRIVEGRLDSGRDVLTITADVRAKKGAFHQSMVDARERTRINLLQAYTPARLRALTFEEFWAQAAPAWGEKLADRAGVGDACRARGVE
jgi:hypothetical protein